MSQTLFDGHRPPPLTQLMAQFIEHLRTERNASVHTTASYTLDLQHWFQFLHAQAPTSLKGELQLQGLADFKLLRDFLAKELKSFKKTTVARRLSVIKGFLKFLYREGYLEKNAAKLIALPKVQPTLPRVLKPTEIDGLIGATSDSLKGKRLRAMVELLYSTGIRISELVQLNRSHVDLAAATVRVLGKGGRERLVPMGRHCQSAVRDYIEAVPRGEGLEEAKSPLFLNREGERVTVRTLQRDLKRLSLEVLGTEGLSVSPHTFRHSCATHLLGAGAGLREIQELLGHRSLVTTQKYTQVDMAKLKASYKKAHPREKKNEKKD